jgi:hypothetical protein
MKRLSPIALLLVAAAGWSILSRKTPIPSIASIVAASPVAVNQTFTVEPGKAYQFRFEFPADKSPGRFHGSWTSQGKSAGLKGATDDTLVTFTIKGSDDKTLTTSNRHPVTGNFDFRYTGGTVTLTFDNSGIIRSSARTVTLAGIYQPD